MDNELASENPKPEIGYLVGGGLRQDRSFRLTVRTHEVQE